MTTRIFDHDWMALSFDEPSSTLTLTWKEATSVMGAEGFQLSLAMVAAEVVARQARRLLVDTREFRFGDFGSVDAWRQRTILPLYNQGGIRRFAYVFPPGVDLPPGTPAGGSESFETRYFGSPEDAGDWLSG